MTLKGVCFFAADYPNPQYPHIVIALSDDDEQGNVLLVPISSIKFSNNGTSEYKNVRCTYYDMACVFAGNEITDDTGRYVLTKPSFARYQWAREIPHKEVTLKQLEKIYQYRCTVSDSVLKSLQKGAKVSKEMAPMYRKYFKFF
jgi:hypothetical protein